MSTTHQQQFVYHPEHRTMAPVYSLIIICYQCYFNDSVTLIVVAAWHALCSRLHAHTQLRWSYGKKLLWLGQVIRWLSLIWMVTQRFFGLCVCVFCVLALAHIQLLPPLPSKPKTMNASNTHTHNHPMWPTARAKCGSSRERAHIHTRPPKLTLHTDFPGTSARPAV